MISQRLTGKVAFVTGAARGQGRAHAVRLAAEGADIIAIDVAGALPPAVPYPPATPEDLKETARLVEATGRQILTTAVDTRDHDGLKSAVDDAVGVLGRLDIIVANAGITSPRAWNAITPEEFRDVMDVNVTGTFLCAQRAARGMIAQHYGRIVNLTSISGERAGVGRVAYGTSKAAVAGLTRQLAMELGSFGITANSVAPGPISTPLTKASYTPETKRAFEAMIPAKRLGTVADVAHAIAFLCGEAAAYVNGVMLAVDGGFLAAGVSTTGGLQA